MRWSLITKFLDIFYMNICFHSSLPTTAARNNIGINMKYRLVRPIIFFNIIASCNMNSCCGPTDGYPSPGLEWEGDQDAKHIRLGHIRLLADI